MKKLLSILMLVVLSLTSIAFAEDLDLAEMTLDELLALEMRIQQEIYERDQFNDIVFYPGTYVVGKDIEPGTYIFQCVTILNMPYAEVNYETSDGENWINEDDMNRYLDDDDLYQLNVEADHTITIVDGIVTAFRRK